MVRLVKRRKVYVNVAIQIKEISMTNKTALITGATSGIGRATAKEFAKNGINIIICGRRQERLDELKAELSPMVKVHALNFDIRQKEKVAEAIASLPEDFKNIDILINNAGNAYGLDTIQDGLVNDWDAMLDINVKGLLYVSKAIIPKMIERNSGQIINIGSTAAKEVYAKGNVYCATKHAVDAITKGMRLDLNPYNIRIGAVHPGMVETEFSDVRFKGDHEKASRVYAGFKPLVAEDIAEIIQFVISRPYHVSIADLVVTCTAQASSGVVNKNN